MYHFEDKLRFYEAIKLYSDNEKIIGNVLVTRGITPLCRFHFVLMSTLAWTLLHAINFFDPMFFNYIAWSLGYFERQKSARCNCDLEEKWIEKHRPKMAVFVQQLYFNCMRSKKNKLERFFAVLSLLFFCSQCFFRNQTWPICRGHPRVSKSNC